jgi:putative ABC transport system permease protein
MKKFLISLILAFKNLRSNIGRTILSLSGIVIGVVSVILVLSLGMGVKNFVIDQVSSFGTDIIQIEIKVPKTSHASAQNAGGMIGGTQVTTFKYDDAKAVAALPNIGAWYAGIMSQQITSFENKKKQVYIMGVTAGVTQADKKAEIEAGEMFSEEDDSGLKQVVVLGSDIKDYFFGDADAVGQYIKVKGQTYRVAGVLKKRGLAGFFNFDDTMYMPLRTLQKRIMGIDHIQFAIFTAKDTSILDSTMEDINQTMRDRHEIINTEDDDFAADSIVQVMDILDKVFFIINALLLALTSISLVVGGVGIMNVMYVAVVERTFEIGLKKAIGATSSDILTQFFLEAVFLTLIGGLAGIIIGWLISRGAELVASNFGFFLRFSLAWWIILIAFGFSAATGMIFGYYPARKASQLTPMDALRKE